MVDGPGRWLDAETAAARLSLRVDVFLRRVKAGTLPAPSYRLGARTPRWDAEALDGWMTGGTPSNRRPLSEAIDAELAQGREKAARGRLGKNLSLRREAARAAVR